MHISRKGRRLQVSGIHGEPLPVTHPQHTSPPQRPRREPCLPNTAIAYSRADATPISRQARRGGRVHNRDRLKRLPDRLKRKICDWSWGVIVPEERKRASIASRVLDLYQHICPPNLS